MKHSWKLCIIFGSMFVVVVMGALLLLNGTIASADEEKREFHTGSSVSRPAIQEGEEADIQQSEQPEIESKAAEKKKGNRTSDQDDSLTANASLAYEMEAESFKKLVADFAAFWKGVPYQYGGAVLPEFVSIGWNSEGMEPDPEIDWGVLDTKGVDSSGFVQAVFQHFQINLPRSCKEQEKSGEDVQIKDAEAGDIIFYGAGTGEATHCGICLGDGRVVHSSSKAGKVIISDMNYRRIISVRRVISQNDALQETDGENVSMAN
ncbi:MAG: NlpC/P60 family protein [Roseburia sp.]|nr:NlpC/P60 family protein [Roseburia sp.]